MSWPQINQTPEQGLSGSAKVSVIYLIKLLMLFMLLLTINIKIQH